MSSFVHSLLNRVDKLSRNQKKLVFLSLDTALIPVCLYLAFALRLDTFTPHVGRSEIWNLLVLTSLGGLLIIFKLGQNRIVARAFNTASIKKIALVSGLIFIYLILLLYVGRFWAPRSVPIIFISLFFISITGGRLIISWLIKAVERDFAFSTPSVVYGTGPAAMQIRSGLRQSDKYNPVCFIDNNIAMSGAIIGGIEVVHVSNMAKAIDKLKIKEAFVAAPEASESEIKNISKKFVDCGVKVHVTPSLMELLLQHKKITSSSKLQTDHLLKREKVTLDTLNLASGIEQKTILVTGAGGSIGSELCRQLLQTHPKKIILCESNEFALFTILNELAVEAEKRDVDLVPSLGSILDKQYMISIFEAEEVKLLFHAAAYKHVTLVEQNAIQAGKNNIVGTAQLADLSGQFGLEKFVLVSSDKAVRPTNIMGATKRMAELLTKKYQTTYPNTDYSVVRFGNVLGSAGSVVPIFHKQIINGGPITITDPAVNRYFMTIPEAAKLVIVAGLFSRGNDTFVLDMGEPIKIIDLAKNMIDLLGYTLKTNDNPDGDIEIEVVGLKPGEKLYEELFFDDKELTSTPHSKIFRVTETDIPNDRLETAFQSIIQSLNQRDVTEFVRVLRDHVEGFDPSPRTHQV